ncbi:hypothetical protein ACGGKE_03665 [Sphingobium naphthae]|uniref:hypothetical protein n=1 Tax=Sphingobium naphthae TaxID=1886786 RepID=UPI0037484C04
MGRQVRIRQHEVDQIARLIDSAGIQKGRVIFDLANSRIELVLGDDEKSTINPWDENDAA